MVDWLAHSEGGALAGLRVLDLSRILAGPTCTQLLGDLGADVIKIEAPQGDDTRRWGPPFIAAPDGTPTDLSAYFLCANRNKRSVTVDLSSPEGVALVGRLLHDADVVVENFKAGGLRKFDLDAETVLRRHPGIVYCSISGFGQTGPNAHRLGYDLLAQGFGGIMSLTGAPEGAPMKVGVGIADVMCGMYACSGILAALRHRDRTGEGQHIDLALVDSQIAWLVNEGTNTLVSGREPVRRGNAHPNIAPYQVYAVADGHVIVAVGNDTQFARFCGVMGLGELCEDPRFATNPARVVHLAELNAVLEPALAAQAAGALLERLDQAQVPAGPVNRLNQVFASDQVAARGMTVQMRGQQGQVIPLLGNPLKLSKTPVTYRRAPPHCGAEDDPV